LKTDIENYKEEML